MEGDVIQTNVEGSQNILALDAVLSQYPEPLPDFNLPDFDLPNFDLPKTTHVFIIIVFPLSLPHHYIYLFICCLFVRSFGCLFFCSFVRLFAC